MENGHKVNVLLVDDQPAKLLSYEVMLADLGENLIKTQSAKQALEALLKNDVAVVLIDVCMPELDGFELATMIRDHPRFRETSIIFVSAIHLTETDHLRGYTVGAVDYVPVPVVPEVLRAKVRVFAELYRKTKQLEVLNATLESRIAERTAELEAAVAHQELLAREVDHRARNALAVVQSIVRLTRADTKDEYVTAVDGRIRALAKTHELLSESRWQGADISRLVAEEAAPFRTKPGRITVDGPSVVLPADKAQSIALVLHELATNAAKYGALSVSDGTVGITWKIEGRELTLEWRERNGPKVQPPVKKGFGTRIIDVSVSQQIDGRVAYEWHPDGLVCGLSIPFASSRADAQNEAKNGVAVIAPAETERRILIVEDEALVAMLIKEYVASLGFTVCGPLSHIAEAMAAANDQHYAGAVLDVNLRGESIYPLAEMLLKKGIPFVFVTGYARDDIDKRFAAVPVLQKPLARAEFERTLRTMISQPSAAGIAPAERRESQAI